MSLYADFKPKHDHSRFEHSHNFAFGHEAESERRVFWVMILTAVMMVIEIAAGWYFNSMAVFADGWHMATHAAALGIGYFAYRHARLNATSHAYSFGTGKVQALGSYSSALLLALVAVFVLVDSLWAILRPSAIAFDESLAVAVVGLVVNVVSIRLLHVSGHDHEHHGHAHDHNLKSAYAHVVVDAMTSVLAIIALLLGKYMGWLVFDALVGIVGAVIIGQWSWGLIRNSLRHVAR